MILKGSQRANGADLASHLMQAVDNESVEIAQTYGTVATDLHGAFAEMEATAAGTNAKNYLYSLSINPSAPLTRAQYFEAIAIIQDRLVLRGQPRAVVFHVKPDKGGILREHCHVVWSKIDAANMKAIHMTYDHAALCDLSCILARKFDLDLPPGLKAWEANNRYLRYRLSEDRLESTRAENAITQETGVTPEKREADITAAYNSADSPKAFQVALVEAGYILARGDKRRYVVVDRFAKVHSLTRYIKGHTAKTIKNRLQAALAFGDLPTVDEAKDYIRAHQQPIEGSRAAAVERAKDRAIDALRQKQTERRIPLQGKEQDLLIRHAGERMTLHAAQEQEIAKGGFVSRIKNAVLALLQRTPGLRSVLAHITGNVELDRARRQELENEALAARHMGERAVLEREKCSMDLVEARELKALHQKLHREIIDSGGHSPSLMTRPDHEDEHLHHLHEELMLHRRKALVATFNAKANPHKKRSQDSWETAPGLRFEPTKRPRGT